MRTRFLAIWTVLFLLCGSSGCGELTETGGFHEEDLRDAAQDPVNTPTDSSASDTTPEPATDASTDTASDSTTDVLTDTPTGPSGDTNDTEAEAGDDAEPEIPTEYCGDEIKNGLEECDGEDFADLTCEELGFGGGFLTCTEDCLVDDSNCIACGGETQICDGQCVDLANSIEHCGACGVKCFPRQFCVAGNCAGHSALSSDELYEALQNKDFLLINVRVPPWGTIPGTDANVSNEEPDLLVETIGPDLHSRVVVYCRTYPRSVNAILQLRELGYSGICYLAGGVEDWVANGYELE